MCRALRVPPAFKRSPGGPWQSRKTTDFMSRLPQGLPTASHTSEWVVPRRSGVHAAQDLESLGAYVRVEATSRAPRVGARRRAALLPGGFRSELRELVLCFLAIPRWSLAAAVSEPTAARASRGSRAATATRARPAGATTTRPAERSARARADVLAIAHRGGTLAGGGADRSVGCGALGPPLRRVGALEPRARAPADRRGVDAATLRGDRAAVSAVALLGGDGGGAAAAACGAAASCRGASTARSACGACGATSLPRSCTASRRVCRRPRRAAASRGSASRRAARSRGRALRGERPARARARGGARRARAPGATARARRGRRRGRLRRRGARRRRRRRRARRTATTTLVGRARRQRGGVAVPAPWGRRSASFVGAARDAARPPPRRVCGRAGGAAAATASWDGSICVWATDSWTIRARVERAHAHAVSALAFAPPYPSDRVGVPVSGGLDGALSVWSSARRSDGEDGQATSRCWSYSNPDERARF